MASGEIAADPDADRATVVVHTPLGAALTAAESSGEIERGPVIDPEVARRLACDARIEVVLEDASGAPVGIGGRRAMPPGGSCASSCGATATAPFRAAPTGASSTPITSRHRRLGGGPISTASASPVCSTTRSSTAGAGGAARGPDGIVRWYRPTAHAMTRLLLWVRVATTAALHVSALTRRVNPLGRCTLPFSARSVLAVQGSEMALIRFFLDRPLYDAGPWNGTTSIGS
jgi:hypothetical protein